MAHIVEVYNPFKPFEDTRRHEHPGGITVRDWLSATYPGFREFTHPTLCLVNGQPLLRADWPTYVIKPNDVVNFVVLAGEPITLFFVFLAITVAASVVLIATMPKPRTPSEMPEPDPVYDLRGQRNQVRLSSPIEVPYGRCRLFPSYAARAYNQYIGNQQYQYQLFCVGQGHYSVESVLIEDTPIENFQDVEYAIYEPGEQVTLFPDNVVTSVEVASLTLYAPNEAEFTDWVGGFIVNPAFTLTSVIELDVSFPQGLFRVDDKGVLQLLTIQVAFSYRSIDNLGNPTSGWATLTTLSKTLKTVTPQRFTLREPVTPGRYEVRAKRINNKEISTRSFNVVTWEAMRAFLPSTKDYGNVTMLAVRARATNNLNDRSSNRINLIATRRLRSWNKATQSWNAMQPTRSLVWAFADLFQASYGGGLDDSKLDLDALADLDEYYQDQERFFDHVFDQKLTVWDAARTIGRVGRALPMINGSRVTLLRDSPKTVPTAVFNPENILKDSFRLEIKLPGVDEYDSVEVEYVEPTTWKSETLLCTLEGGTTNNPEKVTLLGCTDRDWAYREGMYIRAQRRYLRENVTFRTGLEGHIPSYGDLIAVSHDLPRWGTAGLVLGVVGGVTLTLSEPVTFLPGTIHKILLRKKDGTAAGPFTVTAGVDAYHVVSATSVGSDYFFDDINERPLFLFGASESWGKLMTVVGLQPIDQDSVEVRAVNYDERLFASDSLPAPTIRNSPLPRVVAALPVVSSVVVQPAPDILGWSEVSWPPASGATAYVLETSSDGENWSNVVTTPALSYAMETTPGELWVRVAGINRGAGPWAEWNGVVGSAGTPPGNITDLELQSPFDADYVTIQWSRQPLATHYEVEVYQVSGPTLKRTVQTTVPEYTYTGKDALTDGAPKRDLRFSVKAVNDLGSSATATTLDVYNAPPATPTGMSTEVVATSSGSRSYRLSWAECEEPDFRRYFVWGSSTSGFTPGFANVVYAGSSPQTIYNFLLFGGSHSAFYWRVGYTDLWGETESELNISAEQTIPAHP